MDLLLVRCLPAVNILANKRDKPSRAQLDCDGSCGENRQRLNCASSHVGRRRFFLKVGEMSVLCSLTASTFGLFWIGVATGVTLWSRVVVATQIQYAYCQYPVV